MQTGRFTTAPDGRGLMIFDAFLENHEDVDPTALGPSFNLQFMIRAEEDWINDRLQQGLQAKGCSDQGGWITRQASFMGDDLQVELDPALNDVLAICEGSRFAVQVRALAGVTVGLHTFLKDNLNLSRRPARPEAAAVPPAGAAAVPPAGAAAGKEGAAGAAGASPQGAPEAAPAQTAGKSSALPKILGIGAVLLIALAAAAYFLLGSDKSEPAVEVPAAAEESPAAEPAPAPMEEIAPAPVAEPAPVPVEAEPAPEPVEVEPVPEQQIVEIVPQPEAGSAVPGHSEGAVSQSTACSLTAGAADAEILSACLGERNDDALLSLARTAAENQRCELAQRILFAKARSSGGEFARLLHQYFDPATAENPCFKKSAEDAAYWLDKI